jgi:hypothetical protein
MMAWIAWLRDASRQDASVGRGKPRPYNGIAAESIGSRVGATPWLAGYRELAVAGEICAAGFVAIRLAKDFAEAFAGFVDLGF